MSNVPTIANLTNPKEVVFVTAILDLGGPQHAAEAAMRAGYATTVAEAEHVAAFLLGAPRIARAITSEVRRRFDIATATAFQTLLEVCVSQKAPANARIAAAQEILNRSEIGPVMSRSAVIKAEGGIEELLDRIHREDEEAARRQAGASGPQVIDVTPRQDDDSDPDAEKLALLRRYRAGE